MELVALWGILTGFLFGFSCDSPFNRGKAECTAIVRHNDRVMQEHYGFRESEKGKK